MNITIFINKKYIENTYGMNDDLLNRFTVEVFPNLLNRLSMDLRVKSIHIFTSDLKKSDLGFGSKINLHQVDSTGIDKYSELIELSLNKSDYQDEYMVIYNPMFPFISINKIHDAYQQVRSGKYTSAIGVDKNYSTKINMSNIEFFDAGIFSIFGVRNFKANKKRLISPVYLTQLNALELITLRETDDYELYGLVVNAGLTQ